MQGHPGSLPSPPTAPPTQGTGPCLAGTCPGTEGAHGSAQGHQPACARGMAGGTGGHVGVQAARIAGEFAQLKELRVAAVRLRQRLHTAQQALPARIPCAPC